MSRDSNIDYETFCKSREDRFRDWRNALAHRFRDWRRDALGRFTQRGWLQTEAEVTSCKPARRRYYFSRYPAPRLDGWAVAFSYVVDGKTYDGLLLSKEEVKEHGRFIIRYNPHCPVENNTLETKLDLIDGFVIGAYDIFLVLFLLSLVVVGFFLKR